MLYGRSQALDRVGSLIASARAGDGGALLVTGDAGIGKSALLDGAVSEADGMRVLRISGLEAEAELAFSALSELVGPVSEHLDGLPQPQRAALEGAMVLGPPVAGGDRFAVCAGFHSFLRLLGAESPVLVIADDAQWIDAASAECISFAGRRLAGTATALLVASRPGERPQLAAGGFQRIELDPLGPADAGALVRALDADLPSSVAAAIVDAAAGNPLALIELPLQLSDAERAGETPLEPVLAPGERLTRALAGRLAPLDGEARDALVVVAASGSRALDPVAAACRELGIDTGALARAQAAGVLEIGDGEVRFAHPLLRGLVHRDAGLDQRRRVNLALAEHVSAEERGWQLAAAALGTDETAAAALERTSERALARGAPIAGADALERAAILSSQPAERARRLIGAGRAATSGGRHHRAAQMLADAVAVEGSGHRGEAVEALAVVSLYEAGNALEAHRLLSERAAELEAEDPVGAAGVLADAAVASTVAGDCRLSLADAERARRLLGEHGDATRRAQVLSILSWACAMRGQANRARELLSEVDRLLPAVDPFSPAAQSIALAINSRITSEEWERAREECAAIVGGAREAGMIGLVPFPLAVEADAHERLGDWDDAVDRADEAIALAEETGQRGPLLQALVIRLWVHAGRGEEDEARAIIERARAIAEPAGFGLIRSFLLSGLGFLELGLGRAGAAVGALEEVAELAQEQGMEEPTLVPWAADLVEAYVRAGRTDEAKPIVTRLARQAEGAGGAFAHFLAARSEALVAERFEDAFERAYALAAKRPTPFHLARAELLHGERLHRARRRVEARGRLRSALATFERLRAVPWVERARRELRAAGAIERRPVYDDELTAQELRIALAVARGAKNREVAAELYLSTKTIEFHLGRVYRKLGIHSRTELATLVAEGRLEGTNGP